MEKRFANSRNPLFPLSTGTGGWHKGRGQSKTSSKRKEYLSHLLTSRNEKPHQPKETLEVYDAEISNLCVMHFQLTARQLLEWNTLQWMLPDLNPLLPVKQSSGKLAIAYKWELISIMSLVDSSQWEGDRAIVCNRL